jgi:PhoH-like ATPase
MGKDIGFLPGSIEEKFSPWTQPIVDNLDFLLGNSQTEAASYLEAGIIQIEVPTFIRGRTIPNCFMIVDEIQNITKHELKTIMTRVGENTKIILTGDIEQIDNEDVDDASNGLSYAIDKFKKYELSGHITLVKGERSEVATLSAKIL